MSEFLVEDLENGQRVVAVKSIDGTTMGNSELLAEVVVDIGNGTLQRCVAVKDFGGGSGAGAPIDDTTEGTLGKIYIDTTNKDAYICVEADSSVPTYTWKKITE